MNKESIIYKSVRSCYYGINNAPQNFQRYLDTRSIKKYHNKHLGQTCFIVGNGPSMTFEDLNKIHELDVPSFACNKIFLAFDNTKWRPTYYFVSDTKILADVDMNKIGIPLNNMFFPRRFIKDINNRKCNYYETLDHDWLHSDEFSTDAYKGIYGRETIIIEAVQFAYYMGFSKVYIIGVDFNYNMNSVDKKNLTFENGENNYFIKDYAKKGEVLNLPNQDANILGFQAARKAFEDVGREIYNATRGGKLEVFIRKDLAEVFKEIERTKS